MERRAPSNAGPSSDVEAGVTGPALAGWPSLRRAYAPTAPDHDERTGVTNGQRTVCA